MSDTRQRIHGELARLGYQCFESLSEARDWQAHSQPMLAARWQTSQLLAAAYPERVFDGFCFPCNALRRFHIASASGSGETWQFRDDAACCQCNMVSRLRLAVELYAVLRDPSSALPAYISEQLSPTFRWLHEQYPGAIYGSEFVLDEQRRPALEAYLQSFAGAEALTLRHEDLTQLSFPEQSLSAVLSFDVLEHVPDYRRALREMARVLAPGGFVILSAPFLDQQQHSIQRARLNADGTIEHLLPPEYHGDPAASDGQVLCFHHFGWDILEHMREAGFTGACTALAWSPAKAIPSLTTLWLGWRD